MVAWWGVSWLGGDPRTLPGETEVLCILMGVTSQETIKSHPVVLFVCVNFIVCKPHLKKVGVKVVRSGELSPDQPASLLSLPWSLQSGVLFRIGPLGEACAPCMWRGHSGSRSEGGWSPALPVFDQIWRHVVTCFRKDAFKDYQVPTESINDLICKTEIEIQI